MNSYQIYNLLNTRRDIVMIDNITSENAKSVLMLIKAEKDH